MHVRAYVCMHVHVHVHVHVPVHVPCMCTHLVMHTFAVYHPQCAEGLRAACMPDWLQLTGLIHDLGKMVGR